MAIALAFFICGVILSTLTIFLYNRYKQKFWYVTTAEVTEVEKTKLKDKRNIRVNYEVQTVTYNFSCKIFNPLIKVGDKINITYKKNNPEHFKVIMI